MSTSSVSDWCFAWPCPTPHDLATACWVQWTRRSVEYYPGRSWHTPKVWVEKLSLPPFFNQKFLYQYVMFIGFPNPCLITKRGFASRHKKLRTYKQNMMMVSFFQALQGVNLWLHPRTRNWEIDLSTNSGNLYIQLNILYVDSHSDVLPKHSWIASSRLLNNCIPIWWYCIVSYVHILEHISHRWF